jgi:hypothetical protein
MTLSTHFLPEPLLEFANGQRVEHPQDGLFLYGPVESAGSPEVLRVGVIGTPQGIGLVKDWQSKLAGRLPVKDRSKLHTSAWPGFQAVFAARLPVAPLATITLSSSEIDTAARKSNRTDAVRSTVKLYEDALLEHRRTQETRPDVWLVVVPEVVHDYGRPTVSGPKEQIPSTLMSEDSARGFLQGGSLFPDMEEEAKTYLFAKNFHHQLKCQLLDKEMVIQIVRETTLNPSLIVDNFGNPRRSVQEPAKIAWNFATTLYFKARGQPWQLADVRPGVCYVGLVFKQDPSPAARGEACCAAQMFLNSGNGVVFRGALGPWYSEKTREFHLTREAAADLIEQVVREYKKGHGDQPPKELFIHGRQRFSEEEWKGFKSVVPSETTFVGVRIRPTQDLRLFRPAVDVPVLRGTAVIVTKREGYLWTTGYIPRLRTYPGFETPKPILVEINHGDADLLTVMGDVLALTKVNYNSCDYASGLPVTLKFADRVGDILTASPQGQKAPPLPFRYYI